MLNVSEINKEQ